MGEIGSSRRERNTRDLVENRNLLLPRSLLVCGANQAIIFLQRFWTKISSSLRYLPVLFMSELQFEFILFQAPMCARKVLFCKLFCKTKI